MKVRVFEPKNMTRNRATIVFLIGLTVAALYLCYLLVFPFLKPMIFSVVLAVLFYPMHRRIHHWIRNQTIAALLSTSLVILLITSCSFFLGQALLSGLQDIYLSLKGPGGGNERLTLFILQLSERAVAFASRYISIPVSDLQSSILNEAERGVAGLIALSAGAIARGGQMISGNILSWRWPRLCPA